MKRDVASLGLRIFHKIFLMLMKERKEEMASLLLKTDRDVKDWARKFKQQRKLGKVYVLYFTSTECGGCQQYEPHWTQFVKQAMSLYTHKKLEIVVAEDSAMYPLAEKLHFHLRYTPTILFMSPREDNRYKWQVIEERAVPDLLRKLRTFRTLGKRNDDVKKHENEKETADTTKVLHYSYHPAHIKDPANYANLTALAALKETVSSHTVQIEKSENDWSRHMLLTVNNETTYHGHAASAILGSLVRSLCG